MSRVVAAVVGVVLVAATTIAAVIGFSYDARQADVARTDVRRAAVASFTGQLDTLVSTTDQVAGLFGASDHVSGPEFARFTQPMLRNGSASGFAWLQHVPGPDRARFERATGRAIREIAADGELVPAAARDSYEASRYTVAQPGGTPPPLGVDSGSDPARGRALHAAAALGEPQATAVARLVGTDVPGVAVFAPVRSDDGSLVGSAVGAFRLPQLVDAITGMLPQGAAFALESGGRRLGAHGSLGEHPDTWRVALAGEHFTLLTAPPDRSRLSWGAIALLVGGLISALVGLTLSRFAREAGRAERKASRSERRFASAFDHAPVGIALVDEEGRHVRVNDAMATMLGRRVDELTGLPPAAVMPAEDAAACTALIAALVRGEKESFRGDTTLLTSDGRRLRANVYLSLLDPEDDGEPAVLVHAVDVTEQRLAEERMRHLVDHDPLTDLLNRRGFAAAMAAQVAHSRRYSESGALLVLDLDGFKAVNDRHGHEAGDELLVRIARDLGACLRETDVLARLGGDEFAIIVPRETLTEAGMVAGKLVACVRGTATAVTASVGVAPFGPGPQTAEDVLRAADLAMYAAKAAGGDRHAIAGSHREELV